MFFLVMWPLMTGRISRLCVLLPPAGDDASVCCCHCTIYSCVLRLASSHHPTSSFRSCEERRRMGNCQAPEAVVIQHPGGREEQLYWPMSAADVMKSNPGYHVALVTLCVSEERGDGGGGVVRLTRVRLLKPKDVLLLGQVYRLVTSQGSNPLLVIPARLLSLLIWPDSERPLILSRTEVTMALRARKQEKLNKCQQHRTNDQVAKQETDRQRSGTQMAARTRQWRPSLQSIAEAAS
ncbi:uncharacterized protein LOC103985374 isoform X1 [Musa acuminata AAA Group]|uniref:uncharacterized protein LOC103985374 isoform X1 n=1 Tax=Musa acuminata AAA Group TaxID=214697 RepID=UPI0031DE9F34